MKNRCTGLTLIDLLIAISIIAIIAGAAMPLYANFVDNARNSAAASDILEIQLAIDRFNASTFAYPDSLDEIPGIPRTDPWGVAYAYLRIDGNTSGGVIGQQRKDKNLNPLNSDFDLYSVGKDGDSKLALTAKAAHDDIIRAGNGGFVGLAENH